ncbi:MAG: reverse transcriptase domain-containing protein [Chromatiales bacterium]
MANVAFRYHWLCAKAQHQRTSIEFLGIDLSRAFNTICRDQLLETFLDGSELQMICFLLAATSHEPRLSTGDCHSFVTSIGTPQGDSLEAALRDLRSRFAARPPADATLLLDIEYTDDMDFVGSSRSFLDEIERIALACMAEWSLTINASKTE